MTFIWKDFIDTANDILVIKKYLMKAYQEHLLTGTTMHVLVQLKIY